MKFKLSCCLFLLALAAVVAPVAAQGEQAEIVVLSNHSDDGNRFDRLFAQFNAVHPHIKVSVITAADSAWRDVLLTMIAAGQAPDVILGWGEPLRNLAIQGALLDLRPLVERDALEVNLEDFVPSLIDASTIQFGPRRGMLLALPLRTVATLNAYDNARAASVGLPTIRQLDESGGWDWDGFRTYALRLTERDAQGDVTAWGWRMSTAYHRSITFVWGAGGDIFDRNDLTRFTLHQPPGVQGLEFLRQLIWEDEVAPPGGNARNLPIHMVATSPPTGMILNPAWDPNTDSSAAAMQEYNIGPWPRGPSGERVHRVASDDVSISSQTRNPEAAWTFVKWLTGPEGERYRMTSESGFEFLPTRISSLEYMLQEATRLNIPYDVQYMMIAVQESKVSPDRILPPQIGSLVSGAMNRSLNNEVPVATALQEIVSRMEAVVAEYLAELE